MGPEFKNGNFAKSFNYNVLCGDHLQYFSWAVKNSKTVDTQNKNEIRSAVQVKATVEKIGKEIKEEIKQKGIMAKPNKEESK